MEIGEEVSAFAVYKKTIGKKQNSKQGKKGQNKNQSPKSLIQKKSPKALKNGKNISLKETDGGGGEKLPKTNRKRKQNEKKEEPTIDETKTPQQPEEKSAKAANGNPKRKKKDTSVSSTDGSLDKVGKKTKPKEITTVQQQPKPPKTNDVQNDSIPAIKIEPKSPAIVLRNDSKKDGMKILKWLLAPIGVETFFKKFWEKAPCLVERNDPAYFNKLISFEMIDQMLINNHIEFTKNIDITSYKNGQRETLNPDGRAMPPEVWEYYSNGCSIRLLNPQTYLPGIFTLNTTLQEYFHCMVGSNSYLTPPNSQGFAPHYDDIEAFVLQIEGRKRWKLYNARSKKEVLPRVSSTNFSQDEIGEPILEKVLMPGDILYFPRGTIHQAFTEPGYHSLHITLSVYQKQSYADLMEKLFPMILERAIKENVDFRRGLPLSLWHNAGIVYSDVETEEREEFLKTCKHLIAKAVLDAPIDQAVDQLAKKYQHEALPPEITAEEKRRTVFGSKNTVDASGQWETDCEINPMTKVRLLRANILRLVEEEEKIRIYYYVDNSKEYCEFEPNYIEIGHEDASSVEVLLKSYPEYIAVNELPLEDDEERKMAIVQLLWDRGLLMFDKPFN